jgi:hypothetical protein
LKDKIISNCKKIICAYENGNLGQTIMPEETHPKFNTKEEQLNYFTLPMALNYQRNSYTLWHSALKTFEDPKTKSVFNIKNYKNKNTKQRLLKYKLALQPIKQTNTWTTISKTIDTNFGSIEKMLKQNNFDFLKLKKLIQEDLKKGFPYLSGPKIFNYWSWIIQKYGQINLINSEFIEIAPDTHITKCSIKLGIISKAESKKITKEKLNVKWRNILHGTGIKPIEMHAPLWFWSKNNFQFKLE